MTPSLKLSKPVTIADIMPLIVIDTREPDDPHPWQSYFTVETVRGTLTTGDFSLPGCEEWIAIERKTGGDLISCLTVSRERFTKELQRGARIRNFYVICEASYRDILDGNYRSQMTPKSAWESIVALQTRFSIPFLLAGNERCAALLCESILLRWWKEHVKVVDLVARASRQVVG
jgi:DNA excision repair protein ERCC-4